MELLSCNFCNCSDQNVKYRQMSSASMIFFLHNYVTPSPYLWTHLLRLGQEGTAVTYFSLCCNCESWVRRQTGKSKIFLHCDAVFLNIICPGNDPLPEERSCARIIVNACAVNDGLNTLQAIAPTVVKEFLVAYRHEYLEQTDTKTQWKQLSSRGYFKHRLVLLWWKRNRRPEFLSNKYTAKLIRRIILNEKHEGV